MKTSVFKILGMASLLLPVAAFAANTSVTQPEGLVDLTTSDAAKAFSLVKPNSADWLLNNDTQKRLDFANAFDNGGKYDNTDRAIVNATSVDFGYDFTDPTVISSYKVYLPVNGYNVAERAPETGGAGAIRITGTREPFLLKTTAFCSAILFAAR